MLTSSFHSFVSYFETLADSSRRSITKRPSVGFHMENATVNEIEWSQRSHNIGKKSKNRLISSLILGVTTLLIGWCSVVPARADIITSTDPALLTHLTPWSNDVVKVYAQLTSPDVFSNQDFWQSWRTVFTLTPPDGNDGTLDDGRIIAQWMTESGSVDPAFQALNPVYTSETTGNTWTGSISFRNLGWCQTTALGPGTYLIGTLQVDYAPDTATALDTRDYGTYILNLEDGCAAAAQLCSCNFWMTTPTSDEQHGTTALVLAAGPRTVPEPGTYAMLTGLGLVGLAWYRRKRAT